MHGVGPSQAYSPTRARGACCGFTGPGGLFSCGQWRRAGPPCGLQVLAHYQTVHCVQPNSAGSEARVMVYFRVTSPARPGGAESKTRLEALTPQGLFLEWPGVAALPP